MPDYDENELDNITNIETQLTNFGVGASVKRICSGPVIKRYDIELDAGVRVSKIRGLEDDLAMALRASSIRLQIPVEGTNFIGIELPKARRDIVKFDDLTDNLDDSEMELPIILGRDSVNIPVTMDLAKAPHLLVAGQTGSGKSVMINTLISSLLLKKSPEDVKFIMVDPKIVELIQYKTIPHLLYPIITTPDEALRALEWSVNEMERRYSRLATAGVRNIKSYNRDNFDKMSYIVFVIDELADLMLVAGKKAEEYIQRITQKARAVGIHMVLATQRPSVNVITGTIKANVPARIAFKVPSHIDSSTILGQKGAESLLGRGDMLLSNDGDELRRVHGAMLLDEEIETLVKSLPYSSSGHIKLDGSDGSVIKKSSMSELYLEAVELVNHYEMISIKMLVNRLKISDSIANTIMSKLINDRVVMDTGTNYKTLIN